MDFLQAVTHNEGSVFQRTFSFKVHKIAKKKIIKITTLVISFKE